MGVLAVCTYIYSARYGKVGTVEDVLGNALILLHGEARGADHHEQELG